MYCCNYFVMGKLTRVYSSKLYMQFCQRRNSLYKSDSRYLDIGGVGSSEE